MRRGLQAFDITRNSFAQDTERRRIRAGKPRVQRLHHSQRSARVTCQLQLLAGLQQGLFDLGEQRIVAAARRFLEARFKCDQPRLEIACGSAGLFRRAAVQCISRAQTLRQFILQRTHFSLSVIPLQRQQYRGKRCHCKHRLPVPRPRRRTRRVRCDGIGGFGCSHVADCKQ